MLKVCDLIISKVCDLIISIVWNVQTLDTK